MSHEYLEHALRRARTYAGFRGYLLRRPEKALAEYDLSDGECDALVRRDRARLARLGVDPELIDWWCGWAPLPQSLPDAGRGV